MSGPLRIFLSHSSTDAVLTSDVEAGLNATSPAGVYEVLVDQTGLAPGVEWPRYLHEWMARCHAAVILLTPAAVQSSWVLKETTILAWRRSIDPDFRVFVSCTPAVTSALLQQHGYGPLFLDLIQRLPRHDAGGIVDEVRARLGQPALADTLFETLVRRLGDILEHVGTNTLKGVAARLNVVPPKFGLGASQRDQYIDAVARHLICGVLGQFAGVHQLVDALSTAGESVVRRVMQLVNPYWIDAAAAAHLPPILNGAAPRRAIAINGAYVPDFTAEMFVRRAHLPSLEQTLLAVAGGWDGDVVGHVTREICTSMRQNRLFKSFTDQRIVDEMKLTPPRWYAVLPADIDAVSLDQLIDRFPAVAFVLATGESLVKEPTHTRVEWIDPPIDLTLERSAWQHYAAAEDILERLP